MHLRESGSRCRRTLHLGCFVSMASQGGCVEMRQIRRTNHVDQSGFDGARQHAQCSVDIACDQKTRQIGRRCPKLVAELTTAALEESMQQLSVWIGVEGRQPVLESLCIV